MGVQKINFKFEVFRKKIYRGGDYNTSQVALYNTSQVALYNTHLPKIWGKFLEKLKKLEKKTKKNRFQRGLECAPFTSITPSSQKFGRANDPL